MKSFTSATKRQQNSLAEIFGDLPSYFIRQNKKRSWIRNHVDVEGGKLVVELSDMVVYENYSRSMDIVSSVALE